MHLNIPYQEALVRRAFVYTDGEGLEPCWIFGVQNILNRPLLFHCQLPSGALYSHLPISAFVHRPEWERLGATEQEHLSNLQIWDAQSHYLSAVTFAFLQHKECDVRTRTAGVQKGRYVFTLSPEHLDLNVQNVGYQEFPDVKLYHCIRLASGSFGLYPNTHVRVYNADFVDRNAAPRGLQRNRSEMFAEWGQ